VLCEDGSCAGNRVGNVLVLACPPNGLEGGWPRLTSFFVTLTTTGGENPMWFRRERESQSIHDRVVSLKVLIKAVQGLVSTRTGIGGCGCRSQVLKGSRDACSGARTKGVAILSCCGCA
jgi:hypothetical protein